MTTVEALDAVAVTIADLTRVFGTLGVSRRELETALVIQAGSMRARGVEPGTVFWQLAFEVSPSGTAVEGAPLTVSTRSRARRWQGFGLIAVVAGRAVYDEPGQ